jgi:hypothetical protein
MNGYTIYRQFMVLQIVAAVLLGGGMEEYKKCGFWKTSAAILWQFCVLWLGIYAAPGISWFEALRHLSAIFGTTNGGENFFLGTFLQLEEGLYVLYKI